MRTVLKKGMQVGRYELLLPAARGGMAEVWAARLRGTRGFQKLVAVKTLRADVGERRRLEDMFSEEAQVASRIRHPNVVETFELGEADGSLYIVMEWVDGESVRQIQTENGGRPLPLPVAVHLVAQCCKGLHAAHELEDNDGRALGLVHRDVSPHNIMVTYSGIAKLTDFGVIKVNTADHQELSLAGEVKGKVPYMAPEYLSGKVVDRRADIFALGLVLYELTTGRHPFRGETPAQTVHNVCSSEAQPPRRFVPGYPTALSAVVRKAIRLEPDARFPTAMDFLAMLQQALPEAFTRKGEQQAVAFLDDLLRGRAAVRHAAVQKALAAPSVAFTPEVVPPSAQSGSIGAVVTDDRTAVTVSTAVPKRRSLALKPALLSAAVAFGTFALLGGSWEQRATPGSGGTSAASGIVSDAQPSGVDRGDPLPSAEAGRTPIVTVVTDLDSLPSAAVHAEPPPKPKVRRRRRWKSKDQVLFGSRE